MEEDADTIGQEGPPSTDADRVRERRMDSGVITLFTNRDVVAVFARDFVDGLQDLSLEEVKECIDERSLDTRSMTPTFVKAIYDTLFEISVPIGGKTQKVMLNLEGQQFSNLGYELRNRQQFYASDLITSQKEKYFNGTDYNSIRPCYSVWVVMSPKRGAENTLFMYPNNPVSLRGDISWADNYDRTRTIVINIGNEVFDDDIPSYKLATALFSRDMTEDERKRIVNDRVDVDLNLSAQVRKDMDEFEDVLAYNIKVSKAEGIAEGIAEGMEKGIAEGNIEGMARAAIALSQTSGVDIDSAIDRIGFSEDVEPKVREKAKEILSR